MPKPTIIFDIDGTAIDSPDTQEPSQRLVAAIQNAKNSFNLCAATGRVWSFAKPVITALNLTDPCVVSAGTQICNPVSGEVLWQYDIEPRHVKAVVDTVRQLSDFKVLYNDYDHDRYFYGDSMPLDRALEIRIFFLGIIFIPETQAQAILAQLSQLEGVACTLALAQRPGFNDILITNKAATKEHAIAKLLELIGADASQTIGIGDGHNDTDIFNAVKHKVAMANAVPELKAMADRIISSVKGDGMAEYLEKLTKS